MGFHKRDSFLSDDNTFNKLEFNQSFEDSLIEYQFI